MTAAVHPIVVAYAVTAIVFTIIGRWFIHR